MFWFLYSWFLVLVGLWISWKKPKHCLDWEFLSALHILKHLVCNIHSRPAVVRAARHADPLPRAVDARGRPHHGGVQAQEEGGAGLLPGRHQPDVRGGRRLLIRGCLSLQDSNLPAPRQYPPVPGTRPTNKQFAQFLSASVTCLANLQL